MRYINFTAAGVRRFGTLSGDRATAFPEHVSSLEAYLALDAAAREAMGHGAQSWPVSEIELHAPVRPHKNVFCVGRNYMDHAEEVARANGQQLKLPSVPTFFTKAPTAIADPEAVLHLSPDVSAEYDWEAELAVVIGVRCRDVEESSALAVIHQWFKGKSLDDTCPIGPWIVSADEIPEPNNLAIELRVDGERKQFSNTGKMIFDVPKIIASLSRGLTLEPGDVIATGTPDGVGMARKPPEFLRDGQTMEVEIERIGILRNRIALRAASAVR
jgi:2-keto-4-pentenoate hydratase/2-oxohepta-3-ene-1,7-dioic acid hydratase in catechol pathway